MIIEYDAKKLTYKVEVVFPYTLTDSKKELAEEIIKYWGRIPYVSVEGIYSIQWVNRWQGYNKKSIVYISVDFTKSASDDYLMREPLEKLGEWLFKGTPRRKDGTQKHKGLYVEIISVRTSEV